MRLKSLEASGFRGISGTQIFDLDADAVVVVGPNGQGKTSLFDGVLWALTGLIPRLHNDDARLVSMYAESGQAKVRLVLREPSVGTEFTVTRSFDGKESRLALEMPDGKYVGTSAEGRLTDLIWPAAAASADPRESLAHVLTRSVYLQQDLIRQFVEAATDQERFASVSELVGAGRVTELQASLERGKKAWSTATNQRVEELRARRERLAIIDARLGEIAPQSEETRSTIAADLWAPWWRDLADLGLDRVRVDADSREASGVLDQAMKQLDGRRRAAERRLQTLKLVQTELLRFADRPATDLPSLVERAEAIRRNLELLRKAVADEQARLADARRAEVALKERVEQLRALARIALGHLDGDCPVCGQTHNHEATRRRLEELLNPQAHARPALPEPDKLGDLLAATASKEKELAAAELALRSAEQAEKERQLAEEGLDRQLRDLGFAQPAASRSAAVMEASAAEAAAVERISALQRAGETLALRLAEVSAVATTSELEREAALLRREVEEQERDVAARNRTGNEAQDIIEALREAASDVVQERLREIGPLLQSVYARIDPHPSFRVISFLSRVVRGRGHLSTVVRDPIEEKTCDAPAAVLSSSQVNALAVAVFLALSLGVSKPPLRLAILDDPLQTLDDVNLLGLVDLFRRAKEHRQLIVSTHDARFGSLLARKLRPVDEAGRTIVITLDGWTRRGPGVAVHEVKSDPAPFRLVGVSSG